MAESIGSLLPGNVTCGLIASRPGMDELQTRHLFRRWALPLL